MKRTLLVSLVVSILISLAGCGSGGSDTPAPGEDVTHGKSDAPADASGVKTAH
jgi:predicted small lipoprotein YifL